MTFRIFFIFSIVAAGIGSAMFAYQNPVSAQSVTSPAATLVAQTSGPASAAVAAPIAGTVAGASTASAEELRRKIEEQAKNIEALNNEIKAYSELKDKTTAEAKTLQAAIKELDDNAKRFDKEISKTRAQIDKANSEIGLIDIDIQTSEEKIISYRATLQDSFRKIQQAEDINVIETLLAGESMSDALAAISDRISFNDSLNKVLMNLNTAKATLESNKVAKEDKKDELSTLASELNGKKQVIVVNKNERSKILKETKNQEKTYQQLLNEKRALKEAFEKELFSYESALKYTLDPSSIPKSGTGVFSWPLDKVIITQKFGKTSASKRLYVSGSHNGVDFGAKMGTAVKAVLMGKIVGAGDTDVACPGASFGRWVLIEHPNGLSTIYAHLSVISVKKGDVVGTGQVIGYSGNTGYSTGPHLHLGAYASDAVKVEDRPSASCKGRVYTMPIAPVDGYLDALEYLPKL